MKNGKNILDALDKAIKEMRRQMSPDQRLVVDRALAADKAIAKAARKRLALYRVKPARKAKAKAAREVQS